MGGLHCLLYDRHQLLAQLVQVHLLAQRLTEACHDPGCVILAAIKPPIHQPLHALAQGLEQSGDEQGGDDKNHRIARPEKAGQQVLPAEHQQEIGTQKSRGEQTIDQRAIDQHIDIVQAISEHGDPCRDRNADHCKIKERARGTTIHI